MDQEKIDLSLTRDEALVLFEWLAKINSAEDSKLFSDTAEQQVLFNLESLLEEKLVEPFKDDYEQLVIKARERIRDR